MNREKVAGDKGPFTAHYDTYLKYLLLAARDHITYNMYEIRFPWWRNTEPQKGTYELNSKYDRDMGNPIKQVGVNSYPFYVEHNYRYAVVNSYKYQSFIKNSSARSRKFPSFTKFYQDLFAKGQLIKEFSSQDHKRPGPTVRIYKFIQPQY